MGKTHWIATAGLHGYMPNVCGVYDNRKDAVDSMASLHELGPGRMRQLRRNGTIELDIHRDGNEYAGVTECDCGHPEDHEE
jgi:hypothetical protein